MIPRLLSSYLWSLLSRYRRTSAIPKSNMRPWRIEGLRRETNGRCIKRVTILNIFETREAALCARQGAERQFGFHENHGRA